MGMGRVINQEWTTIGDGIATFQSGFGTNVDFADVIALNALIQVSGAGVRFTCDGSDPIQDTGTPPTGGHGFYLAAGDIMDFPMEVNKLRMIAAVHGTTANVEVIYYTEG